MGQSALEIHKRCIRDVLGYIKSFLNALGCIENVAGMHFRMVYFCNKLGCIGIAFLTFLQIFKLKLRKCPKKNGTDQKYLLW